MVWNRYRRIILGFAALSLVATSQAAFLDNNYGGTDTVVNFDQFTAQTTLTATPVQAYENGSGFSIAMNTPGDVPSTGRLLYGIDWLYFNNALVNDSSAAQASPQAVEFTLAGGAVSAIGIRISAMNGFDHTAIKLEAFDGNDVSLGSYSFNATVGGGISPLNPLPTGGFFGFDLGAGNSDIVRFRITGGSIVMDDLRFGGLEAAVTDPGPDPEPDPGAVPEPGTFLLCSAALVLISAAGRKRFGRKSA